MAAPIRLHTVTVEEALHWALHAVYCTHVYEEPPCADCARGDCRTARLLDEAADEAGQAWGRKTGGWW